MIRSGRLLISVILLATSLSTVALAAESSGQWKITSVKLCRSGSGGLAPIIEAIGHYPVYTFFIPRPVWTVNGTVVEAQPYYDKGRLVSFKLLNSAQYLKSGTKNTVKFSLPDQNGSKIFQYDQSKPAPGECYELF